MSSCNFTYSHFKHIFSEALNRGYQIVTVAEWFKGDYDAHQKVLINRIDVDRNIERVFVIQSLFQSLEVKASFYFRLHAREYNLLSFENINLLRSLAQQGHEVGVHSEIEDVKHLCGIDQAIMLRSELALFKTLTGCACNGIASHGNKLPFNNLDFWREGNSASDFGLLYEAYDDALWKSCRYVSESEVVRWKAYDCGKLIPGETRCACKHIEDGVSPLCVLTHPETFYYQHLEEMVPPVIRGDDL